MEFKEGYFVDLKVSKSLELTVSDKYRGSGGFQLGIDEQLLFKVHDYYKALNPTEIVVAALPVRHGAISTNNSQRRSGFRRELEEFILVPSKDGYELNDSCDVDIIADTYLAMRRTDMLEEWRQLLGKKVGRDVVVAAVVLAAVGDSEGKAAFQEKVLSDLNVDQVFAIKHLVDFPPSDFQLDTIGKIFKRKAPYLSVELMTMDDIELSRTDSWARERLLYKLLGKYPLVQTRSLLSEILAAPDGYGKEEIKAFLDKNAASSPHN